MNLKLFSFSKFWFGNIKVQAKVPEEQIELFVDLSPMKTMGKQAIHAFTQSHPSAI